MSKVFDLLKLQDSETVKNSFYRSPKITPHITLLKDKLEVKTIDHTVYITKLEEVILGIITDFKFCPIWLIQQWYEDFGINNSYELIGELIQVGLVWAETSSMGVFIRPTKLLLDLYKEENTQYIDIPFGLLNHTCGEEQIVFDLQMGNEKSELWQMVKEEETLPCYHPLNLKIPDEKGTIVLREGLFKLNRFNIDELLRREDELNREIKSGKKYTKEFTDFSYFPIVNFTDDNNVITQTPDVLVPVPRQETLPQSYAIEIELSAKTAIKYNQIMKNYKNNPKFGKLFYLCGNQRIARLVKEAFKAVGGLGTCELFLLPFIPPAMRLSNYTSKDESNQADILSISKKINMEG